MKRLMVRLAGVYAWIGALTFLLYRLRYRRTSEVRAWTDYRGRQFGEALRDLRRELAALRHEISARRLPASETSSEAHGAQTETRRLTGETPGPPGRGHGIVAA